MLDAVEIFPWQRRHAESAGGLAGAGQRPTPGPARAPDRVL